MMRRLGSLLASSKVSKQPLLVLQRSLAAYVVTTKHSHQPRLDYDQQSHARVEEVEEKGTSRIRIVSVQNVKPDKPTPDNLRSYKLSALDQIHIPSYVPFIFFYRNNVNGNTNIDTIVFERSKILKQSLSETLTRFYPFAGKFIDDTHIDCNDEGVYYTETQVDGDLSSFIAKPDYKLLQGLLPMPPNSKKPTRGFYLVMIQVNFFSCGGVAISMCNSHKLIDGSTYMTFLNAWASAAKDDPQQNIVFPNFIASSLFLQNTQAPTYPSFPLSSLAVWPSLLKKGKCSTKRFVFDASAVDALKAKATDQSVFSTRVVAVTSLIWKCVTTAARKQHGEERPSLLQLAVNLRGKFAPPLPQNAIGNIIWTTVARCESNNNLSLGTMVGHINDGIARIDTSFAEQFKGEQGSAKVINELKRLGHQLSSYDVDYYSFSSMCKSGVYEADFGWGRPVWSCYANFGNDIPLYANVILLMDTSTSNGVEAWVTLSEEEMAIFEVDPELLLYASIEPSPLQC